MVINPEEYDSFFWEVKLVAAVKTRPEAIGILQMSADRGVDMTAQILVDSLAALGAVKRTGNGRMRHVRVGFLWVQQKSEAGELDYTNVLGTDNPADLMTQYFAKPVTEGLLRILYIMYISRRAKCSLTL